MVRIIAGAEKSSLGRLTDVYSGYYFFATKRIPVVTRDTVSTDIELFGVVAICVHIRLLSSLVFVCALRATL